MDGVSRRHLLGAGGAIVAASALGAGAPKGDARLHIVVVGGHPGDPEAGCGGTIARYTEQGHRVTALYLTRGEAGISGKSHEQAGAIRSAEAESACKILHAEPVFASQVDGATEVNATRQAEFTRVLGDLRPDVVFTQWPVDTHADHRACGVLTIGAWQGLGRTFALYYYEVDLGLDTQLFRPTDYVDVTATEPLKRQACMAHQSQGPDTFYNRDHVPMMRFRGLESGHKLAEGFIHHPQSVKGAIPV